MRTVGEERVLASDAEVEGEREEDMPMPWWGVWKVRTVGLSPSSPRWRRWMTHLLIWAMELFQ